MEPNFVPILNTINLYIFIVVIFKLLSKWQYICIYNKIFNLKLKIQIFIVWLNPNIYNYILSFSKNKILQQFYKKIINM